MLDLLGFDAAPYDLVVTRNVTIDLEGNGSIATAQPITSPQVAGRRWAMGYAQGGKPMSPSGSAAAHVQGKWTNPGKQTFVLGGGNYEFVGNVIGDQFNQAQNQPFGSALSIGLMAALSVFVIAYILVATKEEQFGA